MKEKITLNIQWDGTFLKYSECLNIPRSNKNKYNVFIEGYIDGFSKKICELFWTFGKIFSRILSLTIGL